MSGRFCDEKDCCRWGQYNNKMTWCNNCGTSILPKEEFEKDTEDLFLIYYAYSHIDFYNNDDICFNCVKKDVKN